MKQRRSKQQWGALLAEQARSGLSVAAFCRDKGITASHFYARRATARQASTPNTTAFSRAQVVTDSLPATAITINRGPNQLRLPSSVSPQWLAELMMALS